MTQKYIIKGMDCPHCQAAVTKAIHGVEGVEAVEVNLATKCALVKGTQSPSAVASAIRAAGYDVEE